MDEDRSIYELEDLAVQPGTYFNPQTEVVVIVDDSASIDQEIFNMESFEGAGKQNRARLADDQGFLVGGCFEESQQGAVRGMHAHAIGLDAAPAPAAPEVALGIAANSIGKARGEVREFLAVLRETTKPVEGHVPEQEYQHCHRDEDCTKPCEFETPLCSVPLLKALAKRFCAGRRDAVHGCSFTHKLHGTV